MTAATSCLTHDGAAFVVLASQRKVADLGPHVKPLARIIGAADVGVDPRLSPLGTLKVGEKLLQQAGLHFSDMDSIEYNEAFAVISALFARPASGSLGCLSASRRGAFLWASLRASGAILTIHALAHLTRKKGRFGLIAVAGAGGTGSGLLLERVS